jgi:hypothetical protein
MLAELIHTMIIVDYLFVNLIESTHFATVILIALQEIEIPSCQPFRSLLYKRYKKLHLSLFYKFGPVTQVSLFLDCCRSPNPSTFKAAIAY